MINVPRLKKKKIVISTCLATVTANKQKHWESSQTEEKKVEIETSTSSVVRSSIHRGRAVRSSRFAEASLNFKIEVIL